MDTYRFRKQIHKLPGKVIHAIPLPEPEVTEGHGARKQIGEICLANGYQHVLPSVPRPAEKPSFLLRACLRMQLFVQMNVLLSANTASLL